MHTSEEEQLEAIKRWWQENGAAVVVGLVVGLGGLFGWHAWQNHLEQRALNASARYAELVNMLDQGNRENVQTLVDAMREDFAATPYAPLSALVLAKDAVDADDREAAVGHLQWVVDHAEQGEFIPLARLRLARLYVVDDKLDEAEQLLDAEGYPDSYTARRSELRGDVYAARGDAAAARTEYENALNAELPVHNRQMLQIKRDALPPAEQAAGAEAAEEASADA